MESNKVAALKAGLLGHGIIKGAKVGFLAGLGLAVLYAVIGALGDIELTKSLGFTLLFVGFPTLFGVVPALKWLGVQGGMREGVAVLLLTLPLNGALWGAVLGAAVILNRRPMKTQPPRSRGLR